MIENVIVSSKVDFIYQYSDYAGAHSLLERICLSVNHIRGDINDCITYGLFDEIIDSVT